MNRAVNNAGKQVAAEANPFQKMQRRGCFQLTSGTPQWDCSW